MAKQQTEKASKRSRAEIVCDQLDTCRKVQLAAVAEEAVRRDPDWAGSWMRAIGNALDRLEEREEAAPPTT